MNRPIFVAGVLFLLLSVITSITAQEPSRISLTGIVQDTAGVVISGSTVMLLDPVDSTLLNFTTTGRDGEFKFNNIRNNRYLLKVSHVSYMPKEIKIEKSKDEILSLGIIEVSPFSEILMEVVILAAKAPIRIHGDTIEYDVASFRVPPGSTVEDLLIRLPGVDVDAAGNITAQGENVRRVLVDGKTFFGDDPQTVTRNLDSEAISRVQIFNEGSEQHRLTGIPDGERDKAMNLNLKEEYKTGAFGKATVAGGTSERWASNANYNRFDEKNQFSVIGYANNINQSGVNWQDYREFMGSIGFSRYDDGDFGFSSRRGSRGFFSQGSIPISRDSDRGFSTNYGIGTNYNYDNKKVKFNAGYFFNQSNLFVEQQSLRQTFLPDSIYLTNDTSSINDFRDNHSVTSRYENTIDSNQTLIANLNLNFSKANSRSDRERVFYGLNENVYNSLETEDDTENISLRLSSMAIYSYRFKKTGRTFAASVAYDLNRYDTEENTFSLNRFFAAQDFSEQINQLSLDDSYNQTIKSSLLFTDALIENTLFFESFYNIRFTGRERTSMVYDPLINAGEKVDSLSYYYENDILYQRVGTSLRLAAKGSNISLGLAAENYGISGTYAPNEYHLQVSEDRLERSYFNLIPYLSWRHEFLNGIRFHANYNYEVNEPSFSLMQPSPVIKNPLFRTEGNLALQPEKHHRLSSSLHYWSPASFTSIGVRASYNYYDSRIVQNMITEFIDSVGFRTVTRPENISGAQNISSSFWTSVPVIKTKLTVNISGGFNYGTSEAYINDVLNNTENIGYSGSAGLNLTPGANLLLNVNARLNFNDISYSIQSSQNQNIQNHSFSATIRYQFISKTFFESNFAYNIYKNDRFGFDENIPLWNASVRRILGKQNRFEVRIAAFDIFNKRLGVRQSGAYNYVIRTATNTLARYYMFSLSYNLRGYDIQSTQGRRRGRI